MVGSWKSAELSEVIVRRQPVISVSLDIKSFEISAELIVTSKEELGYLQREASK